MDKHRGLAFIALDPPGQRASITPNSTSNAASLPRVICFHGSGLTTHYDTWIPLVREISTHTAVLFYERRGIGESAGAGSPSQTPREAVKDLVGLLKEEHFKPPYILLAHSHGGTFAREFLQQYPSQVAGTVLAETGQETPTLHNEEQYRKQILGNNPLSVIHADSLHGRREGNTTAMGLEMQRRWAEEDERLKKAQLQLSTNARYVYVEGCGHNVVRDRPDVVEEEVRWVLDHLVPVKREHGLRAYVSRLLGRDKW